MFDIAMPLYNKAEFVGQAIEGVLGQTFSDWRLFVVDDGSTDGGAAVADSFRDPRIRVLRQANAGPGVSRNTAIAAGSADWVALLDADDLWRPDHLAELASLRRVADAVLIGTAFQRWDGRAPARRREGAASRRLIRYFDEVARGRLPFFTSSAAFSRAAMAAVGPFQPASVGEDTDLWARLALHGPVAASSKQTVLYRVGTGGLTEQYVGGGTKDADEMELEDIALPVATMVRRLPHIEDAALRRDVGRYIDYEVGVAAFHALRAGRRREVRKLLTLFLDGPRGKARAAAVLGRLPWPWGRRLLFTVFRIKGAARAAATIVRR
jgi:glycosyltransferase involved in cell wall biosynthesis